LWKQVIVEIRLHNVGKKLHLFAQHLLIFGLQIYHYNENGFATIISSRRSICRHSFPWLEKN
jgi:hypothetical protein